MFNTIFRRTLVTAKVLVFAVCRKFFSTIRTGADNRFFFYSNAIYLNVTGYLLVKPLTTKVASFPCPFRGRDCLSEIQLQPQYLAAYAASTAARLIRSDKVQVLLFRHRGTFAPMSCCTVTGTDFKISRMKYREPIL